MASTQQRKLNGSPLQEVQIRAVRAFLGVAGAIIFMVFVRSVLQGSYPTLFGLITGWSTVLVAYVARRKIGANRMIICVIFVLTISQIFLFSKLGLISGGPYALMFTAAFIALVEDKRFRGPLLILSILPFFCFTLLVKVKFS